MIKQPLWQPTLGIEGWPTGVYLDSAFARACDRVLLTTELRQAVERYVWRITKPEGKTAAEQPSDMFTFFGDADLRYESALGERRSSLLVSGVYVRHYASDGKWLTANDYEIPVNQALSYSFHHVSFPNDHVANRWLTFAFSRWVRFAQLHLQEEAGIKW